MLDNKGLTFESVRTIIITMMLEKAFTSKKYLRMGR